MFKYSDESLKKWPWLWKYDKRFKRGCRFQGHRFHWKWFKQGKQMASLGLCVRCAKAATASIYQDKAGNLNVMRVLSEDRPLVLTREDVHQIAKLLAKEELEKRERETGGTGKTSIERTNPQKLDSSDKQNE